MKIHPCRITTPKNHDDLHGAGNRTQLLWAASHHSVRRLMDLSKWILMYFRFPWQHCPGPPKPKVNLLFSGSRRVAGSEGTQVTAKSELSNHQPHINSQKTKLILELDVRFNSVFSILSGVTLHGSHVLVALIVDYCRYKPQCHVHADQNLYDEKSISIYCTSR